jgi:hypothetical protein
MSYGGSAAGSYPALDLIMIALTRIGVPVIVFAVAIQWWSRADRQHMQWADGGKPLYTYVKDKKPGDVAGDNFENIWHVVKE